MDAFDTDVLIYAAGAGHVLGERVRALFARLPGGPGDVVGIGSVLLVPEVLSKPMRDRDEGEVAELGSFLSRLELIAADLAIADLGASMGAAYRLRAADAIHLATAVAAGADRFITNNRSDFPKSIVEVDVTYPEDLPE